MDYIATQEYGNFLIAVFNAIKNSDEKDMKWSNILHNELEKKRKIRDMILGKKQFIIPPQIIRAMNMQGLN